MSAAASQGSHGASLGAPSGASSAPSLELVAHAASPLDADRGVVRLDPGDLVKLGVRAGDVVALAAKRVTYARALPAHARHRGLGLVLMDSGQRENCGAAIGEPVRVYASAARTAEAVTLAISGAGRLAGLAELIRPRLLDVPLTPGDRLRVRLIGGRTLMAEVTALSPEGPALPGPATKIGFATARAEAPKAGPGYEDLGGLDEQIARVREMVELPLRRPELFARLGVEPPKGVLFTGPPGTGKTLLAKAVAAESSAAFFQIAGPEIVSKHYGDSEAALRKVFEQAEAKAPSIIFIDEIDAIAPKREQMAGDRQLERRVVAQLLTLLDGLSERGQVVVMAATNLPDSLDPALRRPGRFDREILFRPPSRAARREILAIHARGMPLSADVDLDAVAGETHGFVGADLAALTREAALAALRGAGPLDTLDVAKLEVTPSDFREALKAVGPSAIREVFTETPEVGFADVGGLADIKAALAEAVIAPLKSPETFIQFGVEPAKGALLAGPPGCGKTLLAKALARESGVNFISVRGAQMLSRFLGESERAVREVFAKARLAAPCILFFDEIDALAPRRTGAGDLAADRIVAQLLTEIDGVEDLRGVFLLAATNRIEAIDPALLRPGRFDLVLDLPAPDESERLAVLEVAARGMPMGPEVDLAALAAETEGLVGADLTAIIKTAARIALRRRLEGAGDVRIGADDLAQARRQCASADATRGRMPR